ncbi:hypothetical protein HK104_003337 [Borealophlyctis nickersoniae]|nr:hypothetical protein HK104_003337 [Borealophlyctis nickersoniae]
MSSDIFWRLLFQRHFPALYTDHLAKDTNNWHERYKSEILSRCRGCMRAPLRTGGEETLQLCDHCRFSKPEYTQVSATAAKKRYLLNDKDLERLHCDSKPNGSRRSTFIRLFMIKDLERAETKKFGGQQGVARAKAKVEAARKKREETLERRRKEREERLERQREQREDELKAAVEAKGLPFSWIDSASDYVHGAGKITLDSVVSDMAEIHVLHEHTRYPELSSAAQHRLFRYWARGRSLVLLAEAENSYEALPPEQKTATPCSCGRPLLADRFDAQDIQKLVAEYRSWAARMDRYRSDDRDDWATSRMGLFLGRVGSRALGISSGM